MPVNEKHSQKCANRYKTKVFKINNPMSLLVKDPIRDHVEISEVYVYCNLE